MASSIKLDIVIPENHRVELTLPDDLPPGPAEVIVLPASPQSEEEPTGRDQEARSLADLFTGRLGLIDSGGRERLSENGGEKLTDHLEAKRRTGHL